ncbi:hypothetical protein IP92_03368 [Pseudoduganella flava]|uniref:Uncharacterized protein n=1 Tax=Pseudoduganella flava TaxID=871742 RepID=A0A562PNE0_9BURK|nr:hypothetical protein [Pseudoduganella flava]QGZ40494.1 hypothetical protein GO485_16485 [Pseudoduganella flava]TWI45937.1 hypothetical protein IP92_03368 [Pseudoduganella flava]
MGTRFGRRAADGTYEYHDSRESLVAAERRERSANRAFWFGIIGFIAGAVLTYTLLAHAGGLEWPRLARFGAVLAGGGVLAWALSRLADLIWYAILSIALLAVLTGIGAMIWDAV